MYTHMYTYRYMYILRSSSGPPRPSEIHIAPNSSSCWPPDGRCYSLLFNVIMCVMCLCHKYIYVYVYVYHVIVRFVEFVF